ncbi:MAG: hypothetical protein K6E77_11150 [Lachnospiraceae bacterium]|nr:hypothetical protein [Lachnospiraceae bacterium]
MKTYLKTRNAATVAAVILMAAMSLTGCGRKSASKVSDSTDIKTDVNVDANTDTNTDTKNDMNLDINVDTNTDIDIEALNKSVDSIKNLEFDTNVSTDSKSDGTGTDTDAEAAPESDYTGNDTGSDTTQAAEPSGKKTVYSFTDAYVDGNDITIIPNGGMNSKTVLYGGKDLEGFLDYVDSDVLEKGRKINRDFFYDMLAIMMVDKDLSSDEQSIENNLIMSLAMANNFHDMDVKINDCYLDANNAAEYRYHVTAYDKDDTWVINYRDRTMYMNDGKTEYVSEMFKNEYLAVWMVAIEDYYGLEFK